MDSRELFNEYILSCGIDPNDIKSERDQVTLGIAFGAWQTQQLKIDNMQLRLLELWKTCIDTYEK